MEAISWEMVNGIKSFRSLLDMVMEVLGNRKIKIYQRTAGWDWYGCYLTPEKMFVGVYFATPNLLTFEVPVSSDTKRDTEFGYISGGNWRSDLDLASEEVHFFSRPKTSQIQCIEEFIMKCYDYAQNLLK